MRPHLALLILVFGSLASMNEENFDFEYRRRSYVPFQVTDIFGAAQLIKHLLKHSQEVKKIFETPGDIIRATFLVGGLAAAVKLGLVGVQTAVLRLPSFLAQCYHTVMQKTMDFFGVPQGFNLEHIQVMETMFQEMMATFFDEVMRKEKRQVPPSIYWQRYCASMLEMIHYLKKYVVSHQRYYRQKKIHKMGGFLYGGMGDSQSMDHIFFMIHLIVDSLDTLDNQLKKVISLEDIDIQCARRVTENVLILFRQIKVLLSHRFQEKLDVGYDMTHQLIATEIM